MTTTCVVDKSEVETRVYYITSLLEWRGAVKDLDDIIHELSCMEWDCLVPLVRLTKEHITNVLEKYINNEVSDCDVERWANFVEGRDDVLFPRQKDYLKIIINELANPVLEGKLDKERAKTILSLLKQK